MFEHNNKPDMSWTSLRSLFALLLMMALAACGGDSDEEDNSGDTTNPPPTDSSILTNYFVESFAEYEVAARRLIELNRRYLLQDMAWFIDDDGDGEFDAATEQSFHTYPLQSSGVYYAHAAGLTGAGQVIAFVDDGFLDSHEVFAEKSIIAAGSLSAEDHGTSVASVAAGNSPDMIGMAPGADLVFGSFTTFESRAEATRLAERLGAVALNNSWGFLGATVDQDSFDYVFSSAASLDYLSALKSYAETGVVIFASSNDTNDAQASLLAALPVLERDLEAGWIAAINADADMIDDDVVAARRLSAACLEAAPWCLAAEGTWMGATAAAIDSYDLRTGSSFAAPMIAGAMAILGEAFPDMSPHDLRIRLLASADNDFSGFNATGEVELIDGFFHDISDEWGHGFLDVKSALLPIGTTTATLGDGSVYNIAQPLAVEGGATGDAITRALTDVALVVDDALDAQFSLSAGNLVARQEGRPLTDSLYASWENRSMGDCCGLASYFPETRVLGTRSGDMTFNLMIPAGSARNESYGVNLERHFQRGLVEVSANLSLGRGESNLLPSWYSGGGSALVAGGLELTAPLGSETSLELSAGYGSTIGEMGGAGGSARLSSARAAIVTNGLVSGAGRLTVSVGLPVAVANGRSALTLPVEIRDGVTEQRAIGIDLAPENREIRLSMSFDFPVSARSDMVLSAAHAENFGNVTGKRQTGLFLGFRTEF